MDVTGTGTPTFFSLTLDAGLGHDDDILADPEGRNDLERVSAGLLTLSPTARCGRIGVFGGSRRDRLDIRLGSNISGYSRDGVGPDVDLRADLSYQRNLGRRLALDATASVLRFRRREIPVFDLNQPEAEARLAWSVGRKWLLAGGLGYAHPAYPSRSLDGGGHQADHRSEVSGSLLRRLGQRGYAALRSSWWTSGSSDPLASYHGPLLELRAGGGSTRHLKVTAWLAFNDRSYPDYPVLAYAGPDTIDTGRARRDRTWQASLTGERSLSSRILFFVSGLLVRQTSNAAGLAFDEARITGGVSLELWKSGSGNAAPARLGLAAATRDSLAPEITASGVRFRFRAPSARKVMLVGTFNGWDGSRDPLTGPDLSGIWETVLPIPRGSWAYAFVVDGKWVRPPGAPRYEEDGFGGEHGVLDLALPAGTPAEP